MKPLPVDSLLPDLTEKLRNSPVVILEAPPGSGKTTRVAPSLVDAGICNSKRKTYLLQPRRVAARATAQRIAEERGWTMGQEVGYQVRFENRCSATTSLVVATEGVLLRRMSGDPVLSDIGTVILDEFHERSLNSDLLLGMLLRIQEVIRDDLRLVVMSATLNTDIVKDALKAPLLTTTGTLHPVDIKYRPPKPRQSVTDHVVETVLLTIEKTEGDVLVFLPGVGEINRALSDLQKQSATRNCSILPLHGSLPLEQQNRILKASEQRRIVLSTNVAETSLTLEGIHCVIDSGLVRVLRFNPAVGLDRLQLESICQSSATQRAGRAGRLQDGICIRLWGEKSQRARPSHLEPEIRRVDLSAAVLQLLQWGEAPDGDFPWLEPPRAKSLSTAVSLLEQLGAAKDGKITRLGEQMAALPASPRLARMMVEAQRIGQIKTISLVAAMLSQRDPFLRPSNSPDNRSRPQTHSTTQWNCDITQRYLALHQFFNEGVSHTPFGEIHRVAARTVQKVAEQLVTNVLKVGRNERSAVPAPSATDATIEEAIQRCLLAAFPDRLARRRKSGNDKGRMVGGRGVRLSPTSGVKASELFLCIDVDAGLTEAIVRQASGIELSWLPEESIDDREEQFFNPTRKQVEARRRTYFADLLLSETPVAVADDEQCRELLLSEAAKNLLSILPDEDSAFASFITRMKCLRQWAPELELPSCDDGLLLDVARQLCPGRRSFVELRSGPWLDWLKARLTPEQLSAIERECPERITVPSGSRIKLNYTPGKPPVLAVRIQEVFSWTSTPRVAFGRIPILLHLLAPNMRPQQVTDDLASFWANTYEVVRKELRRRYPKHAWPEDPLTAKPHRKG